LCGTFAHTFAHTLTKMGKQIEGEYADGHLNGDVAKIVQDKAADELVRLYKAGIKKKGYPPTWGDEIEYAIVQLDSNAREANLSLKQSAILKRLDGDGDGNQEGEFTAEFAKYMVEGMPSQPHGPDIQDMLRVEESMAMRYSDCPIS
jgi:glutamate--cysteine ligase catalytic subunit